MTHVLLLASHLDVGVLGMGESSLALLPRAHLPLPIAAVKVMEPRLDRELVGRDERQVRARTAARLVRVRVLQRGLDVEATFTVGAAVARLKVRDSADELALVSVFPAV